MNKTGSGSKIDEKVQLVIAQVWGAHQKELAKKPEEQGKKLNIKTLLDDVNNKIFTDGLRDKKISRSQLYVEIKELDENLLKIEEKHPFWYKSFNLGRFLDDFGTEAVVDGDAIDTIIHWYEFLETNWYGHVIFTNRHALWVARLRRVMYNKTSADDKCRIVGTIEYYNFLLDIYFVSDLYTNTELYGELTGEMNTAILDNALAYGDWKPEFEKAREQLGKGDERYLKLREAIGRRFLKKDGEAK